LDPIGTGGIRRQSEKENWAKELEGEMIGRLRPGGQPIGRQIKKKSAAKVEDQKGRR